MLYPGYKAKALTLSYDDGVITDIRLIEILKKYGIKATFNLNSGLFNKDGMYVRRLSYEEARGLYINKGMEVALHTLTHPNLLDLSYDEILYEIEEDKRNLERMTNLEVSGIAYPFGSYNSDTIDILKKNNIEYGRTVLATYDFSIPDDFLKMSVTCRHKDKCLFDLANKFISLDNNEASLFYLWGHSYEFYHDDNFSLIEDFSRLMGNRASIWYATNIEVVRYIKAFRAIKIDYNKKIIINNTNIDLYILLNGRRILVRANSMIGY